MLDKELLLTNLINIEEWQKIQDSFSEVTGVTLRTFSPEGGLLSNTSQTNPALDKILATVPHDTLWSRCLSEAKVEHIKNITDVVRLKCPLGFDVFMIPIRAVGANIIACLILGPILVGAKKSASLYTKEAEKHGITTQELADAISAIKILNSAEVDILIKLLQDVFSHMAQTGYHKKRLGEIASEVVELDPIFSRYYERKILKALLNASTFALNADSGSVMIVDKETNILHIKASTKLNKNVIHNTGIKVGEGIAGMAAATAEAIILPKDKNKNNLEEKMNRDYIKSSLIVPFSKKNSYEVYGVISLNILRKDVQFSDRDIKLVNELVNMARVALLPIAQRNEEINAPQS